MDQNHNLQSRRLVRTLVVIGKPSSALLCPFNTVGTLDLLVPLDSWVPENTLMVDTLAQRIGLCCWKTLRLYLVSPDLSKLLG